MKIIGVFNKLALEGTINLTKRERILIISFCLVPVTLLILIMYLMYPHIILLKFLVVAYIFFVPPLYAFYYVPEKFQEKFKRNSDVHSLLTYQYYSKSCSLYLPGVVAFILFFGEVLNQRILTILISLAFIIPFVSAFFRTDVFNDSSCIIGDEIVLGYHPLYILFSLIVGLFGFYNVYNILNVNFNSAICLFVFTVIFQIIFVVPNWINKIVPFEVRKKEGFILYNALTWAIYLLISFYFMGNSMFKPIPHKISLENIFINLIGIIFLILIIRQGKNMGKKEK